MKIEKSEVLAKINQLRKERGITKVELAKEAELSLPQLTYMMQGQYSIEMMSRLLNVFGYEVTKLTERHILGYKAMYIIRRKA